MTDDNSHLIGTSYGVPDGNPHTLRRRPLDREYGLSGVITRLVGLQYLADREKQVDDPKQMLPLDAVPDVKGWLASGSLPGFVRSDDGAVFEIVPGEWDDAKIENCLAGRVIQARAEPSNGLVEVPGTSEPAVSWDELAELAQSSDRDLPGDEMVALATVGGFSIHGQIVTGKPFFLDRDIERVFGYGWEIFTPTPSLDEPAEDGARATPTSKPASVPNGSPVSHDAGAVSPEAAAPEAAAPEAVAPSAKRDLIGLAKGASKKNSPGRPTVKADTYKATLREFYYSHSHKREIGNPNRQSSASHNSNYIRWRSARRSVLDACGLGAL